MEVLTVRQAAQRLQVAPTTVYGLCARRKLAHLRIGAGRGAIRITAEGLAAYLAGAAVQAGTAAPPPPPTHKPKHLKV
jgi:excisionase family DNA binding protein